MVVAAAPPLNHGSADNAALQARAARNAGWPDRPRVRPDGTARLVPITFAVLHGVVYSAVDTVKAKRTVRLARLDDIARDPRVPLLVDHYAEDWSRLWWCGWAARRRCCRRARPGGSRRPAAGQVPVLNGRRYEVKPDGTTCPISGVGIVKLNRIEHLALHEIAKSNGDAGKIKAFSYDPKYLNNPESIAKARSVWDGTYR